MLHILITVKELMEIPNIIANADQIEKAGSTDHGKPAIQFIKNINGKNVVVEYVSGKRRMLYTQTMWINKKNPPTTEDVQAPPLTSSTVSGTDLKGGENISPIPYTIQQGEIESNSDKTRFQLKKTKGVSPTLTMPENESDPYRTSETYSGITLAEDSIQQKEKEYNGNKTSPTRPMVSPPW